MPPQAPEDPRAVAQEYIESKRVDALFQELGTRLVFERPADANGFLLNLLRTIQANRADDKATPFFNDEDLTTLFDMFDPTGRGEITAAQYEQALLSLGIERATVQLPARAAEKVDKGTFVTCVKEELEALSL